MKSFVVRLTMEAAEALKEIKTNSYSSCGRYSFRLQAGDRRDRKRSG